MNLRILIGTPAGAFLPSICTSFLSLYVMLRIDKAMDKLVIMRKMLQAQ